MFLSPQDAQRRVHRARRVGSAHRTAAIAERLSPNQERPPTENERGVGTGELASTQVTYAGSWRPIAGQSVPTRSTRPWSPRTPPPPLTHRPPADDNLRQRHQREQLVEAQPGISCPSCGHANRPDRRFCTKCGRRLGRACASCGTLIEEEENFCGHCGAPVGEQAAAARAPAAYTPKHLAERILAEQAAMESRGAQDGERKTITALFADIKGSGEMMEGLDP
jgi:hypothetical protein